MMNLKPSLERIVAHVDVIIKLWEASMAGGPSPVRIVMDKTSAEFKATLWLSRDAGESKGGAR